MRHRFAAPEITTLATHVSKESRLDFLPLVEPLRQRVLVDAYPERSHDSPLLHAMVAAGRLGQKSGSGYYVYAGRKGSPDPEGLAAMLADSRAKAGLPPFATAPSDQDLVDMTLLPVVNEVCFSGHQQRVHGCWDRRQAVDCLGRLAVTRCSDAAPPYDSPPSPVVSSVASPAAAVTYSHASTGMPHHGGGSRRLVCGPRRGELHRVRLSAGARRHHALG